MSLISSALGAARALSSEPSPGISSADISVRELTLTVGDLQRQVVKLTNMNVALFELLKERSDITDQDLIEKIEAIEKQAAPPPSETQTPDVSAVCETCGKTYSKRNNRCLYCGHVNARVSIL